ncbi:MAG: sigma-70 family RNA polymerase sigma factor [Candidatus Riflebacteria bacterium]|nr:sigma-70 family RNA polymerase sigma factor [Candidatus Riflebacteria bacterium]
MSGPGNRFELRWLPDDLPATRAAFAALAEASFPAVFRQAHALLGTAAEAEEATRDVFREAWKALPGYDGGKPGVWLAVLTHRVCADRLGLARKPVPDLEPASPDGEDDELRVREPDKPLGDHLESLPPLEREILILRLVNGLTTKEAARVTGFEAGPLGQVLARSLRRLRSQLLRHGL